MITLSKRLQTVADLVKGNSTFCDVGTDHAFLPTYLLLCGKINSAIASDIKKGPLSSAYRTAKEYGVVDKMQLVLSDGLENVPQRADEIAIAGMGGMMIFDIISKTPWAYDTTKHFILQPMTKIDFLRKNLYKIGFEILSETAVVDGNRPYTVMSVRYCGVKKDMPDLFCYIGKLSSTGDGKIYCEKQIAKLNRKINGLKKCVTENETEILRLEKIKNDIESLVKNNESN